MSNNILKPLTLGAVIVGGLALSQSSFAMTSLAQGYLLSAQEAAADKGKHGSCGEGKCGAMQADSNKDGKISAAEHAAMAKARFDSMDKNKDGMVDAAEMKAGHEGKCGEGKCGADKGKAEGKCGEGKCGAGKGKAEGKCGEGKCGDDKKK